jgi:hypothetical protein
LKSLIKITVKSLFLIFLFAEISFSQQDTTLTNETDTVFIMQKSPWFAVLQSAVIPGLGQIYNESYIKAPIIWTITGLLVYGWIYNDDLYKDGQLLYIQTPTKRNKDFRDFYRDQRDMFTIYMGLVYFLNLVDAYVDAQLFDFNVEENFLTKTPMLNLRINF